MKPSEAILAGIPLAPGGWAQFSLFAIDHEGQLCACALGCAYLGAGLPVAVARAFVEGEPWPEAWGVESVFPELAEPHAGFYDTALDVAGDGLRHEHYADEPASYLLSTLNDSYDVEPQELARLLAKNGL